MLHPHLQNQIHDHLGKSFEVSDKLFMFLKEISKTYEQYDEIRRENEELRKTNLQLENFVYSVSHDLRAPLGSMKGVITITEEETKEEMTIEHMKLLKESIHKLDHFIIDVLDYCRSKRLEMKPESINFREIIEDIASGLKHLSQGEKNVDIKVTVDQNNEFCSDRVGLSIVLNNLVSNAIRYKDPKSSEPFVNIEVSTSDDKANIIVKDNGIGISKELQGKIFDMFYRVSDESEGTGLGLFLVKETVDKLQGQIKVESELGKGSVFRILIPNNINLV